jgi:Holliday junction resolvasome RuvABC endonuclease subunit
LSPEEYDRDVSSMGVIVGTEDGRPVVRGVILDDSGTEVGEIQHLTDLRNDVGAQLDELAKAIETAILGNRPELVVIRLGRIHLWQSRRTTATRARAEGVLLATCRDHSVDVLVMDGDEVARAVGGDGASADKAAKSWASKDFVEAGAAALAAHSIAQRGGRSS